MIEELYCIDCEHYQEPDTCIAKNKGRDVVTKEVIYVSAHAMRETELLCGYRAKFFKPKPQE